MKPKSNNSNQNSQLQQAITLLQAGKLNDARVLYKKLLIFTPNNTDILTNLGTIEIKLGNLEEGVRLIDKSLEVNPKQPFAYNNRGIALKSLQQLDYALVSYDCAIKLKPDYAEALVNRGILLRDLKRYNEALISYDTAIALDQANHAAFNSRGNILKDLKQLDDALASYDCAIKLKPDYAEALVNKGILLRDLKRYNEALTSYERAITLQPSNPTAYSNRGNTLKDLKQFEEALACYELAITFNPDYAEAYWNQSLLYLLLGNYKDGWKLYEWGWKNSQRGKEKIFSKPLWLGKASIRHKTLLIHAEQGLGDMLQFCRYILKLQEWGANVILEISEGLISLIGTLSKNLTIIKKGEPLPDFDYHCPMMSLPLAFETTVESIPAVTPYLYADAVKKITLDQNLGKKTKPRLGLVWSGSDFHKDDHNRSLLLKQLQPLLQLPYEFHSLQKEVRVIDMETLNKSTKIHQHQDKLNDFSDTAALVDAMDLVISVDTSVAHLAGAMGKKLWILLPFIPDFRWMLDRKDSPWYPTATLFRQQEMGDWSSVISDVVQELNFTKFE
ncbi:MAG: tetratricopeptide repeat-containing glycosyltransferase family protein [Pseudomonadota bacterium]